MSVAITTSTIEIVVTAPDDQDTVTVQQGGSITVDVESNAIAVTVEEVGRQGAKGDTGDLTSSQIVFNETPSGVVNGVNQTFTTAYSFASGKLSVYLNGLLLTGHYSVSGNQIILDDAPLAGDELTINYIKQ